MYIFEVKNINKSFITGDEVVNILKDVSFNVKKGEILHISGRSGSGKSTLMSLIGGIDLPNSGNIKFRGVDITELDDCSLSKYRKNNISFILQDFGILPFLTVKENISYGIFLKNGMISSKEEGRVIDAAKKVGVLEKLNLFPDSLSGGQQQRVAIARAIATENRVIIADEPTANLDSYNANIIIDLFGEMSKNEKYTIIISSHDSTIKKYSTSSLVFTDNQVIFNSR